MDKYYKILGIPKNANGKEVKKAYRRLAKKYHPDVNDNDDAEIKFKVVLDAYKRLMQYIEPTVEKIDFLFYNPITGEEIVLDTEEEELLSNAMAALPNFLNHFDEIMNMEVNDRVENEIMNGEYRFGDEELDNLSLDEKLLKLKIDMFVEKKEKEIAVETESLAKLSE